MNQHLHRVIFNRARSLWIAVQETATSGHGGLSTSALSAAAALCLLLAAPHGLAQIIADPSAPGRERPMVINAANGTPTVQIQTPSAAGVSRNRYQQFDMGQRGERGAILNNSRTPVQSQIGGWVPGNPWLANGSARVIVNEVQSAAQSRLAGTLEVAGQRADVIVANPSGLLVNGLSLINAAGLTLTTGAPRYDAGGNLEGFSVRGGAVHLEGHGFDAGQADYAQVLARAITLNAGLWGQDLRMVTGINELSADGEVQSSAPNGAPKKPVFALDVAHLGGMYAHKIRLIGTEAGLGVRNAGILAAATGPLMLSADGQLSNSGVIASQGAGADLEISARGIDNSGTLAAQRLDLTAARLDNAGRIVQTGPQLLDISSLAVSNQGKNALLGAPAPSTDAPAPAVHAAPEPTAPAGAALRRGRIHMSQRLANTGELLAGGVTDVKAIHSFVNSGAANLRELHSEGRLDNRKGALQLQRLTGAQTSVLNTQGTLFVASDLRFVARHIDNTGGVLRSAQSLSAEVLTLTNDAGTLSAAGSLHLNTGTLSNRGGTLLTAGAENPLHITSATGVDNSAGGWIQSGADLQLFAGDAPVDNQRGLINAARDLLIESRGLVDNRQGQLQAGNALTLRDTGVAQGTAFDQATQTLSNEGGQVFSANTLYIRNQTVTGAGRLDALGDLTLEQARDLTHQGTMAANGKLKVEIDGKLNNQGRLLGGTATEIVGTQLENQHGAEISARQGTTAIRASQGIANRGLIDGQDTRLDAYSVNNIGTGRIYGDHLSIAAQRLENRTEQGAAATPIIAARQDLDLGVPVVINTDGATLQSLGDLRMGESLDARRHAVGRGQLLNNTGARIDAQGDMKLEMGIINNLNAGVETAALSEVTTWAPGDLISLLGKEPDSAALYREVKPGTFVPFSANKGGFNEKAGIPGSYSDGRMFKPVHPDRFLSTLAAGAAALNIYTQQDVLRRLAEGKDTGLSINLTLGSSKSHSERFWSSSTMRQSQVVAGGNVTLEATGAGRQSNLLIQDSRVHAGKKATLRSDNRIDLLTTPGTRSESSRHSSRSAGLGLSLGAGGPAVSASGSKGQGSSRSEERLHAKTLVSGGEGVDFHAGGDMLMREAVISGPKVLGRVAGNLIIESLQDSARFDGRQSNASGSVTLGMGHAAGSAGTSRSRARGDFASTGTPAGIQAGDEGFDIEVKGKTQLIGGVIASTQDAIDHQRNRLVTRTLITSDIENRSDFEASGINLSGGITTGGQKSGPATGSDTVTDPATWSTQNQGRTGRNSAAAGVSRDKGSERSITRSGVSPGAIVITDEAAQLAQTGQTTADTVASLNRDVRTNDPNPGLTRNWDGQKLMREQEAHAEIASAFGQQASKAASIHADQQELNARRSGDEETATKWEEGGEYRTALHSAIGALSGGLQGAAGAVISSNLLPVIGERIAELNLPEGVREALTIAAATALGSGGQAPGAAAAFNQAANNYVSHSPFPGVRRMLGQENARLLNECGANCTQEEFRRIDQQVAQLEIVANLAAIGKGNTLTQKQTEQLSQVMLELVPIYGSLESVAQLITGKSSLTREEVSRLGAAIGVVPVAGGVVRKIGEPLSQAVTSALKGISDARKISAPVFATTKEAAIAAEAMGYKRIHQTLNNQAIFKKGDSYITRDIDGHHGGAWKEASSIKNLSSKELRNGTFNADLSIRITD